MVLGALIILAKHGLDLTFAPNRRRSLPTPVSFPSITKIDKGLDFVTGVTATSIAIQVVITNSKETLLHLCIWLCQITIFVSIYRTNRKLVVS